MLDEILFARTGADATFSAARLMAINIHRSAFDIAGVADGDGHVGIGDQVFDLDLVHSIDDLRTPTIAEFLLNLLQFGDDYQLKFFLAAQNFLELGDLRADVSKFLQNVVDGKARQTMQLQFQDGVNLDNAEADHITGKSIFLGVEFDAFEGFRLLSTRSGHDFDRLVRKIDVQILARI